MGPRPLDPDEPGQIGGYRVVGVLGEGGQGVVYLGAAANGASVAVKVLRRDAAGDDAHRRRFLREVEAARRVAAFCTAQVLDLGEHHGRPYVVSEYIPGPSLAAAVAADGPRTGSGLHRLAVATLTALAAIHEAGIVHRDFKPANVILGPEGPVVIDFGIARAADQGTTGSGVMGTPAYLAPEQLSGRPPAPASDMFGWACTMVFAATGRLAFPGDTVPAILMAIAAREPDLSAVPGPLRPLLTACLAKDPAARPTAAALLREVTGLRSPAYGETPPTATGPPVSTPTRPSDLVTSHAVPSVPATAPTTSAYAPGFGATPASERGDSGADGVEGGPRRRRRLVVGVGLAAVLAVAGIFLVMWVRSPDGPSEGALRQAPVDGTLLYEDDFSERGGWDGYTYAPNAPGDQRSIRGYEIDRGVYTMFADGAAASNTALSPVPAKEPGADAARDVQIAVTAEIRDVSAPEGGIGLLCRWDENVPNGYAFRLGLDGAVRVSRTDRGVSRAVGPAARVSAPRPGTKTRLQAACRSDGSGTRLTFWIDGAQAIDVTDPRSGPAGGIGQAGLTTMVVPSGGGSLTVSFDDFAIHRLN